MVAHQTLTLFVRVRILHPLPLKPLELHGSRGFSCSFDPYRILKVLNIVLHPVGAAFFHALRTAYGKWERFLQYKLSIVCLESFSYFNKNSLEP